MTVQTLDCDRLWSESGLVQVISDTRYARWKLPALVCRLLREVGFFYFAHWLGSPLNLLPYFATQISSWLLVKSTLPHYELSCLGEIESGSAHITTKTANRLTKSQKFKELRNCHQATWRAHRRWIGASRGPNATLCLPCEAGRLRDELPASAVPEWPIPSASM